MTIDHVVDGETELDSSLFNPWVDHMNGLQTGDLPIPLAGIAGALEAARTTAGNPIYSAGAGVINVMDGADIDPTGMSDSTAGLLALVAAANEGDCIYTPPGVVLNLSATIEATKRLHFVGTGEWRWTSGVTNAPGIKISADGCQVRAITLTNPNSLGSQTGGRNAAILICAHWVEVSSTRIDNWQNGIVVDAAGEWHDSIITNNFITNIFGAGDGPLDTTSTYGEDRGDGIVTWGASAIIAGNIVEAKAGSDCRIGIHAESLGSYIATPWPWENSTVIIQNNVVRGAFRRGIAFENIQFGCISGNVSIGATWWGIAVSRSNAVVGDHCIVSGNVVVWNRAAGDLSGEAWSPVRAPMYLYLGLSDVQVTNNSVVALDGSDCASLIRVLGTSDLPLHDVDVYGNRAVAEGSATVGSGIHVDSGSTSVGSVSVRRNVLRNLPSSGVFVYRCPDAIVDGNRIYGQLGTGSKGIQTTVGTDAGHYANNRIRGFSSGMELANQVSPIVENNDIGDCTTGIDFWGVTGNPVVRLNHVDSSVTTPYANLPATTLQDYTATNVTTDRAFDASSTTLSEIANVLGTLIDDLAQHGVIR